MDADFEFDIDKLLPPTTQDKTLKSPKLLKLDSQSFNQEIFDETAKGKKIVLESMEEVKRENDKINLISNKNNLGLNDDDSFLPSFLRPKNSGSASEASRPGTGRRPRRNIDFEPKLDFDETKFLRPEIKERTPSQKDIGGDEEEIKIEDKTKEILHQNKSISNDKNLRLAETGGINSGSNFSQSLNEDGSQLKNLNYVAQERTNDAFVPIDHDESFPETHRPAHNLGISGVSQNEIHNAIQESIKQFLQPFFNSLILKNQDVIHNIIESKFSSQEDLLNKKFSDMESRLKVVTSVSSNDTLNHQNLIENFDKIILTVKRENELLFQSIYDVQGKVDQLMGFVNDIKTSAGEIASSNHNVNQLVEQLPASLNDGLKHNIVSKDEHQKYFNKMFAEFDAQKNLFTTNYHALLEQLKDASLTFKHDVDRWRQDKMKEKEMEKIEMSKRLEEKRRITDELENLNTNLRHTEKECLDKKCELETTKNELLKYKLEVSSFENLRRAIEKNEIEVENLLRQSGIVLNFNDVEWEKAEAHKIYLDTERSKESFLKIKEDIEREKRLIDEERRKLKQLKAEIDKDLLESRTKEHFNLSYLSEHLPLESKRSRNWEVEIKKLKCDKENLRNSVNRSIYKSDVPSIMEKLEEKSWLFKEQESFLEKTKFNHMVLPEHRPPTDSKNADIK